MAMDTSFEQLFVGDQVLAANGEIAFGPPPSERTRRYGEAVHALRAATVAVEQARVIASPSAAPTHELWKARTGWSVVDGFESDGRHYVIARENPPTRPRRGL